MTPKEITSFGKYLVSEKRRSSVSHINRDKVTHADEANWSNGLK